MQTDRTTELNHGFITPFFLVYSILQKKNFSDNKNLFLHLKLMLLHLNIFQSATATHV
jgi:hypothetical protein